MRAWNRSREPLIRGAGTMRAANSRSEAQNPPALRGHGPPPNFKAAQGASLSASGKPLQLNCVRDRSRFAVRTWLRKAYAAKIPGCRRRKSGNFSRTSKVAAKAERTKNWPRPELSFPPPSGQFFDNARARPPRGPDRPAKTGARRERPKSGTHWTILKNPAKR